MTHTPEPWELRKHNGINLFGAKGRNNDWYVFEDATEKDANRIVSCVNAFAGIETPSDFPILGLIAENSEMRTELAQLRADKARLVDVGKRYRNAEWRDLPNVDLEFEQLLTEMEQK